MSASDQHYSLRWNDYTIKIVTAFQSLRDEEDFVDVTVACDGHHYPAHKMVLSACSPYFRSLLRANPCQHPIIILKDVGHVEMERLLEFMYNGEVNIAQDHLAAFLKTAENLKIRGLAGTTEESDQYHNKENSHCPSVASSRVSPNGAVIPILSIASDCKDVDMGSEDGFPSPLAKKRKRNSGSNDQHTHAPDTLTTEDLLDVRVDAASHTMPVQRDDCQREMKSEPSESMSNEVFVDQGDAGLDSTTSHTSTLENRSITYTLGIPGPSGSVGGQMEQNNSGGPGGAVCEALNLSLRSTVEDFTSVDDERHRPAEISSEKFLSVLQHPPNSVFVMETKNEIEESKPAKFEFVSDGECYSVNEVDFFSCADRKLMDMPPKQNCVRKSVSASVVPFSLIAENTEYKSKVYPCVECQKVFRHPMSLHHHRHVHKGTYTCHTCGKVFSRRWDLHRHIHRSKMGCRRSNSSPHSSSQCHPVHGVQGVLSSTLGLESYVNNPPSN